MLPSSAVSMIGPPHASVLMHPIVDVLEKTSGTGIHPIFRTELRNAFAVTRIPLAIAHQAAPN